MGMLGILKIVGISVLVLLLLLLVLLVLCLFVPFQYRVYGKLPEKGKLPAEGGERIAVSVSLLLFIFRLSYKYTPEGKKKDVRVFGIPVSYFWSRKKKVRQEKRKEMPGTSDGQADIESGENDAASDGKLRKQTGEPDVFSEEGEKKGGLSDWHQEESKDFQNLEYPDEGETGAGEKASEQMAERQKENNFFKGLRRIPENIRDFFYGFWQFLGRIKRMGRDLQQMQKEISDVWQNVHVRNGISFAWEKLRQILRHIRPRRVEGRIHFGFPDPAVTGQILGGCSMVYAFYGDTIQIEPDFEQSAFDGELRIRGRFQLFTLLWMAWTLYRNREVRYAMKRIQGIGGRRERNAS